MLSIEKIQGRNLVVLWAPGGQNRPYMAPKEVTAKHRVHHYYIRRYSSTVEAKGDDQRELLSLTATVPFDDRLCQKASVEDLRLPLDPGVPEGSRQRPASSRRRRCRWWNSAGG